MNQKQHKKELTMEYFFKRSLIQLAKEHKASCNKEDCDVSFGMMYEFLKRRGMTFTKEEVEELL